MENLIECCKSLLTCVETIQRTKVTLSDVSFCDINMDRAIREMLVEFGTRLDYAECVYEEICKELDRNINE